MAAIIDTHAHLDHLKDLGPVLEDAWQAGVEVVIAVSEDLASSRRNLEISQEFPQPKIYPAFGLHPENAGGEDVLPVLAFIKANANQAVAVGEIGLDFWYKEARKSPEVRHRQEEAFSRQLALATELKLPVVIHSRGAWKECLAHTKAAGIGRAKAVFHWYSGPLDVLAQILDAGYFISATPSLAYSEQSRAAVNVAPVEQTLIETDSPVYYRLNADGSGFNATPKNVADTLRLYSELKRIEPGQARPLLNKNAREFFGLDKRGP